MSKLFNWFFVFGIAVILIAGVYLGRIRLPERKITAAETESPKSLPPGWTMEFNDKTKEYRPCRDGVCLFAYGSHGKAIEAAWGILEYEEQKKYWRPVQ